MRRKTDKHELISWETGSGDGRHDGAGSRNAFDSDACGSRRRDQTLTGIGYGRGPRVRHERDRIAAAQAFDQARRLLPLVVFVKTRRPRRDRVVLEELRGPACILGRNQRDFAEDPQGPQRDIFEVADRRGDHVQNASHARGADSTRMYSAEPLPHFVDEYLSWLHEAHPTNATFDGVHAHDDLLEDLSRSAIDGQVRDLGGFARRLAAIDPARLTDVERLERPALDSSIRARLYELEVD